jgi:hypothetical protein
MPEQSDRRTFGDAVVSDKDVPDIGDREVHGGMPMKPDDDELAARTERERAALGLEAAAPGDVPPATDPLPENTSKEADLAQRGLLGDTTAE